jgi:hypothetical protein
LLLCIDKIRKKSSDKLILCVLTYDKTTNSYGK